MFCLEPLIMAGYLFMANPNRVNGANLNAPMLEVQSCERGVGVGLKAAQSGVYALEAQYGFQLKLGSLSIGLVPKAGVGYQDVLTLEQQSKTNFSLGTQVLLGYDHYRIGAEWWHISNAGTGERNAGLDMFAITAGWAF